MQPTSLRLLVALEEVDHEGLEVVSLDLHGCREVASTSPSRCRAWWVFAVHDPWVLGQTPPCIELVRLLEVLPFGRTKH